MKKILIGAKRNYGDMPVEGSKKGIKFDNMMLYLADFDDFEAQGFTVKPFNKDGKANKNLTVKIRTSEFKEIVGIHPKKFLENFKERYMFHKVKVSGVVNDYGEIDIDRVMLSKKDCFELRDEEIAEEKAAENNMFTDDPFDDDGDDSEDVGFVPEKDEFDEFDVDEETGEVTEKSKKKE